MRIARQPLFPITLALIGFGTAACSDSGVAAIRIELNQDFSGAVTTSSLQLPSEPGPLESKVEGVQWTDRANLYAARGTFPSLSKLVISDIRFEGGTTEAGFSYLKVVLPRGDEVKWPSALVPDRTDRERVSRTFDPRHEFGNATAFFTIEVDLPGTIISDGVEPTARGLTSSRARRRATLAVPVDRGRTTGDAFEWHVTWK